MTIGHTSSSIQRQGTESMGAMMRGSQKLSALPVIQHLAPSRFLIVAWAVASRGGGGRPCWETKVSVSNLVQAKQSRT